MEPQLVDWLVPGEWIIIKIIINNGTIVIFICLRGEVDTYRFYFIFGWEHLVKNGNQGKMQLAKMQLSDKDKVLLHSLE